MYFIHSLDNIKKENRLADVRGFELHCFYMIRLTSQE